MFANGKSHRFGAAVFIALAFAVLAYLRTGSQSAADRERSQFAKECESEKGCPFRDPKSHADWVPLSRGATTAAFSSSTPLPLKPVFDVPDLPATGGRVVLFGIFAADTAPVLVDHLLRHYLGLGVNPKHLLLVINDESGALLGHNRQDDPAIATPTTSSPLLQLLEEHGLGGYYYWPGVWSNSNMAIVRQRLLRELRGAKLLTDDDWILELDADELQVFPALDEGRYGGSLPTYLAACDAVGINTLFGVWRDRVAADGFLHAIAPATSSTSSSINGAAAASSSSSLAMSLAQQLPVMCALRTVGKIVLRRAVIAVSDGKHKVTGAKGEDSVESGMGGGTSSSGGGVTKLRGWATGSSGGSSDDKSPKNKKKKAEGVEVVYLEEVLPVMHFKWVEGAMERLEHKVSIHH
jgi:hypothetical protein